MLDPDSYADIHRLESPEQEKELLAALLTSFSQTEALHQMWVGFETRSGTALAGDDTATPYERTSQWLSSLVGVAFDNLLTVKLVIQDAETVPVAAHFGLLRNAIEAIGMGLWLIGSNSRDTRVLRTLQLSYEDRQDEYSLNAVIEENDTKLPDDDAAVVRLAEIRDARSGLRGRSLTPPSITKRLTTAQAPAGDYRFSLLAIWKLTSGIAHGRRSTFYHLLDREVTATTEDGASIFMSSSYGSVAGTYRIALHYLMRLLTVALGRNGTQVTL